MTEQGSPKDPERPADEHAEKSIPPSTRPESLEVPEKRAFELRGAKELYPGSSLLETQSVTVKAEFIPGPVRSGRPQETVQVAPDDVLEIEFDTGERLWLRGDEYYERFGAAASRDASGSEVMSVPADLALLPTGMRARGPTSWVVKSLKVLGIDLAEKTAVEVAESIDSRVSEDAEGRKKRPGPGLYHCAMITDQFALTPVKFDGAPSASPYLVFIHGTASSTWGSFGDLWSADRKAELDAMCEAYGDRVLAFEHATLSESPIENALKLASKLPDNARLHVVTHSRGGLVGELLCRTSAIQEIKRPDAAQETKWESWAFQPQEYQLFEQDEKYRKDPDRLSALKQLDAKLKSKRFKLERLVRVACPALGTTLASGRLDRWFSVLGSLVGTVLPDTPLSDMFKDLGDFVAAVIKERTDPATLPGLEAVMPESALIKLINWPNVKVPGDLAVIAGDIDPESWWARLLVWVSDRFYESDHDLVVNTPSMYGGVKRSGKAVVSYHKGPEVNHFRYFQNQASARMMVKALTGKDLEQEGFEPLTKPTVDIARAVVSRTADPKPVVFVIPGIMGSELQVGDDHVWLDVPDLIFGGFKQLHIEAANVRATQVFARYYGDLIQFLAQTHKVLPFPYDWRLAVEKEADRLAQDLWIEYGAARQNNKPVRIVAHSMGGLVARAMIARHESLWREICSIPGARLVMLGTPNGGSHCITELLVGQSSTLRMLALLDITLSNEELLAIISRFPGVLAMLPKDHREDYFSAQTWKDYHDKAGGAWVLPGEADLAVARELRQLLDNSSLDPSIAVYVAGSANVTPAEMYLDRTKGKPGIRFLATTRGDGRVTWDSGIPVGVPTWYMNAEHGDLAAREDAFPALQELLEQGSTTLLPQTPSVSRAAEALFPRPPAADEIYPDQDVLAAAVLGAGPRKRRAASAGESPVQVSVVHGNLSFAAYPVAVGHYAGDTIISAEKQLDRVLSNVLSRRHQLGIYPGALETSAVFINPKLLSNPEAVPRGAIVIGLGTVGNLSAAKLTRTVTRALLEYVTERCEHGPQVTEGALGRDLRQLGITALLIGTGAGGMTVSDSVFAILQGVRRVNRGLRNAKQEQRIRYVEFIELYEDQAVQALKAVQTAIPQLSTDDGAFVCDEMLNRRDGALRRMAYEEPGGWPQRLQILGGTREGESDGTLRFSAATSRARNEVRLLATQRALVDRFIAQSIRTTRDDRIVARTLFELLLPNELKEQAPDQDDLVLILDEDAARYPWELLEDRWSETGSPFAIERVLLRQLESGEFRESIVGVTDPRALVIGDPISEYVELKAAQEEAKAVARKLQSVGRFQVEQHIRASSEQVINALFKQAYRVIHLAGHGVYRMEAKDALQCKSCGQALPEEKAAERRQSLKPVTGMIIGDGVVLSPKEVEQMRRVPELVFINCCHLGYVGPEKNGEPKIGNERADYHRIAANVATQFIRIGVRAVVAAGWAVDDAAAQTFAVTFYEQMCQGRPFGKAVHEARRATYERHPGVNTWGAYQCYGDPDYCLIRKTGDVEASSREDDFVSSSECIVELGNTVQRLKTMAGADPKQEIERLRKIEKVIEKKKWSKDGALCSALGRAFGEAGMLDEAISYYEGALVAEDGEMSLRDIEQLANLEIRGAVRLWKAGEEPKGVLKAIDQGINRLESLMRVPDIAGAEKEKGTGRTEERLSLLGNAYKRRAWVNKSGRKGSLDRMVDHYRQAFAKASGKGRFDAYSFLNWLTGELALDWQKQAKMTVDRRVKDLSQLMTTAQRELAAESLKKRNFWTAAMIVDRALLEALLGGSPKEVQINDIADRYLEARKMASPREFESVLDQIDFLIAMAEKDPSLTQGLTRLLQKLK
jgi:pimeloyl-ACP methyl ester carboxylesterase